MNTSDRLRDVLALESYRVVLTQAVSSPEISEALDKIGFNTDLMKEGSGLIEKAREIFDSNLRKKNKLAFAHASFSKRKKEVERKFRDHRNKARLLFQKGSLEADKLAISDQYPGIYAQWVETARRFYSIAAEDKEIQTVLLRFRLSHEEINKSLSGLDEVENLLAEYIRHKGDSSLLPREKNKAFEELKNWMRIFFGTARLALREEPELLGALERHVG